MRQDFSGAPTRLGIGTVFALSIGLMFSACVSAGDGALYSAARPAPPIWSVSHDGRRHAPTPMTVAELVKLSGNPCDSPVVDSQCMNDEDDIKFTPDCDAKGFHAVVSKRAGAALLNRVPPRNDTRVHLLAFGKVVCVQGVARIGTYPAYLFVTTDAKTAAAKKCEQVAPGRFEGDCAMGWVDRDDMKLLGNTK